jgi:hypothetical protein
MRGRALNAREQQDNLREDRSPCWLGHVPSPQEPRGRSERVGLQHKVLSIRCIYFLILHSALMQLVDKATHVISKENMVHA